MIFACHSPPRLALDPSLPQCLVNNRTQSQETDIMSHIQHSVFLTVLFPLLLSTQYAHGSPVDQGSTTLSLISPNLDPAANLKTSANPGADASIMSGCYQGNCPDFSEGLDLLLMTPALSHHIRVRHKTSNCDACNVEFLGYGDGCSKFTMCDQNFEVCIDKGKQRAHRIIDGNKSCFKMRWHDPVARCMCAGNLPCHISILRIEQKVACTW
jgi:hypothetical protein